MRQTPSVGIYILRGLLENETYSYVNFEVAVESISCFHSRLFRNFQTDWKLKFLRKSNPYSILNNTKRLSTLRFNLSMLHNAGEMFNAIFCIALLHYYGPPGGQYWFVCFVDIILMFSVNFIDNGRKFFRGTEYVQTFFRSLAANRRVSYGCNIFPQAQKFPLRASVLQHNICDGIFSGRKDIVRRLSYLEN